MPGKYRFFCAGVVCELLSVMMYGVLACTCTTVVTIDLVPLSCVHAFTRSIASSSTTINHIMGFEEEKVVSPLTARRRVTVSCKSRVR